MRRWLFVLGLLPVSLTGCYHDESHAESYGGWYSCEVGVSFDLTGLQERLDENSPVTVRACFDDDCDVLTITGQGRDRECGGPPGGPPDQLTGCRFYRDGSMSVDILRVDSQNYHDGRSHTAAISLKDSQGERLFSHAETVTFSSDSCSLAAIRLAQR